MPVTHDTFRRK